jgi:hypothetical protein
MVTVGNYFYGTPLREIFLLHVEIDFSQIEDIESE